MRLCPVVRIMRLTSCVSSLADGDIVGRSGKMHAWQWDEGAQPDLQIVGKGLGGGYAPISSVLISSRVVEAFQRGSGAFNNGKHITAVRRLSVDDGPHL